MINITLLILMQLTNLKYVEVIMIERNRSPKSYVARLITESGDKETVVLYSEKPIRVKIFTRATVQFKAHIGNYSHYELIYTEVNQRQAKQAVGKCSWGRELQ